MNKEKKTKDYSHHNEDLDLSIFLTLKAPTAHSELCKSAFSLRGPNTWNALQNALRLTALVVPLFGGDHQNVIFLEDLF